MWVMTRNRLPAKGRRVIGVRPGGRALLCEYTTLGKWLDVEHGCYCYVPPVWWCYLPLGSEE